ncbi:hypothetical protein [Acidovorax sp. sic0104]|uniref:hypothetical protein n=1 Tax=Acidovorax sp. sic0104 TaxID=2854784 RepID=UPI001C4840FB|nr:hypothetical protein [Acidovorax sp. sic0104]MBV7539993.1 hypothetical protein [Acidovorax sp. sic0104]
MPALQLVLPEIAAPEAANDCTPPEAVSDGSSCAVACIANGGECAGNEKRKGRKPTHVSAAARKAAYRADKARVDFTDKPEIIAKLRETAGLLDCSVNELLQSMVRFAECNRNWKQVGLYGARANGVLQ